MFGVMFFAVCLSKASHPWLSEGLSGNAEAQSQFEIDDATSARQASDAFTHAEASLARDVAQQTRSFLDDFAASRHTYQIAHADDSAAAESALIGPRADLHKHSPTDSSGGRQRRSARVCARRFGHSSFPGRLGFRCAQVALQCGQRRTADARYHAGQLEPRPAIAPPLGKRPSTLARPRRQPTKRRSLRPMPSIVRPSGITTSHKPRSGNRGSD